MSFTIIHFLVIAGGLLLSLLGILAAFMQKQKSLRAPMIFSTLLLSALVVTIGIAAAEKYTKKVKLIKIDNRRYLTQEKISYFGLVKNVGKYRVKNVYLTIKLVNGGHATGKVKGPNYYKPSGFFDFFSSGANKLYKPQTIEKEFVIARDLKPGVVVPFRVTFDYPAYFKNTAQFIKVYAH